jgi:hypothetical protein
VVYTRPLVGSWLLLVGERGHQPMASEKKLDS